MNTRARAAQLIAPVISGRQSFTLPDELPDAALCAELSFGTLRWLPRLETMLERFLTKPLRAKDGDIRALLLIGLYQLDFLRIPDHAAVDETVSAAHELGKPWAARLVNGVLRARLRAGKGLDSQLADQSAYRFAHPAWMVDQLRAAWPEHFDQIIEADNSRPPMCLRVNLAKSSRDHYLQLLAQAGMQARPGTLAPTAVYLEQRCEIGQLPGFTQGLVSVQDEAAQLSAALLAPQPGDRLLDACAAPGGKSCHLLELQSDCSLDAVDIDSERLQYLAENLQRLGLEANLKALDVGAPGNLAEQAYDRVLVDAPCSGTGVIRRHPDIKCLRKPVQAFLESRPEAKIEPIDATWGTESGPGRQLLPQSSGTDGFYYALLRKTTG